LIRPGAIHLSIRGNPRVVSGLQDVLEGDEAVLGGVAIAGRGGRGDNVGCGGLDPALEVVENLVRLVGRGDHSGWGFVEGEGFHGLEVVLMRLVVLRLGIWWVSAWLSGFREREKAGLLLVEGRVLLRLRWHCRLGIGRDGLRVMSGRGSNGWSLKILNNAQESSQ